MRLNEHGDCPFAEQTLCIALIISGFVWFRFDWMLGVVVLLLLAFIEAIAEAFYKNMGPQ